MSNPKGTPEELKAWGEAMGRIEYRMWALEQAAKGEVDGCPHDEVQASCVKLLKAQAFDWRLLGYEDRAKAADDARAELEAMIKAQRPTKEI